MSINLSKLKQYVWQPSILLGKNTLTSKKWFPQVPLSLAIALIGLLHLFPVIRNVLGWQPASTLFSDLHHEMENLTLWGIPQTSAGILLLLMSLGLLWRSRIAWATCSLTIFIGLLLQLNAADSPVHWWRMGVDSILWLFLISAYSHFDRHNITIGSLFALVSLTVFMGYAVFGTYRLGNQFDPPITELVNALYFVVVTITSVGYGDITPTTIEARVFLISMIILGVIVLGTAVGATLVPAFITRLERITVRRETIMKRTNHYIIVGHSALASNTYNEFIKRGEQVTVILLNIPENHKYADVDIVTGDGSDIDTLRKAGGEDAKAILALLNDDSENAFVILAAKELKGGVKTVAAVNDVKNMDRIRRVHPYFIIAPQVLGSELLTMALTGEKVDSSTIMQRLLGQANLSSEKKHSS